MYKSFLAILFAALVFVGCTTNETVTLIVQKTYSLITKAQGIVTTASPESFAKMASTIDASLGFVSSALTYVTPKVTKPAVLDAIKKAQESIAKVQTAIKTLTPETLAQTKETVVMSLDVMLSTVSSVASYFNIPLPVSVAKASADPIKDLQDATDDLSKILPKK